MPHSPLARNPARMKTNAELIAEQYPMWDIIAALRSKIARCPTQGMKVQMDNALDTLQRMGFTYCWLEGRDKKHEHDLR